MPSLLQHKLIPIKTVTEAQRAILAGDRFMPYGEVLSKQEFAEAVAGSKLEATNNRNFSSDPLSGLLYAHHGGYTTAWFYTCGH